MRSEAHSTFVEQRVFDFIDNADGDDYLIGMICDYVEWDSKYDLLMLQKFGIDMADGFNSGGKVSAGAYSFTSILCYCLRCALF